jgi:NAD(P)H dehydrogenase (quinone)
MSVVVTGATGQLGRHVVESLLERGLPATEITAAGRAVERLDDLAARGVSVAAIDYDDPASLETAFAGADVLVLVSASAIGERVAQHLNALKAAQAAGVGRIVYTSIPEPAQRSMILAQEHRETEAAIVASGVPYTFVRNAWYIENYTPQIPGYLEHGVVGAARDGRVSVATRRDYADAAAVVALDKAHAGKAYELGGDSITLTELAALVSQATGAAVAYTDVPQESLVGILAGAGFPQPVAEVFADVDARIAEGALHVTTGDLERLIGRTPTSAADAIAAAVAG